jgi:hypothetical protein
VTDQCKHCAIRGDIKECRSETCHQHENWYATHQQKENDQLKAQVERMRDTLHTFGMEHWLNPNVSILPPEIAAVLNETPAQSLTEHDAALLEGFGNKMLAVNNDDNLIGTAATYEYYQSVAEDLFQEAEQIRQEALSNE